MYETHNDPEVVYANVVAGDRESLVGIDPDVLYLCLSTKATARTLKSLQLIHAICRDQKQSGAWDFSCVTIARLSKRAGGVGKSSIYNATTSGRMYQALIASWAKKIDEKSGKKREPIKDDEALLDSDEALLDAIDKPQLRASISIRLSEYRRLRGKNAQLREAANQDRTIVLQGGTSHNSLSDDQRRALLQSISPSFLSQQGWVLDKSHDIRTIRGGSRVLPREFVEGIRKVCGNGWSEQGEAHKRLAE